MAKKSNKLNASAIKNIAKKEFEQKKVTIEIDGKEYDIMVDSKFKKTKIQALIQEGLEKFQDYKELSLTLQIGYINYLMIKYMTDLDLSDCKTFEDDINTMNNLLDLGIFEKVVSEFSEEEIKKVTDEMLRFSEKVNEILADEKKKKELEDMVNGFAPEIKEEVEEVVN